MKQVADFMHTVRFELRSRLGLTGSAGLAVFGIAIALYWFLVPRWQNQAHAFALDRLRLKAVGSGNVIKQKGVPQSSVVVDRYARSFPTTSHNAADLGMLGEQAKKASISLERGEYQVGIPDSFGFVDYEFLFPVKTDYAHLRSFIAGVLNAAPNATLAALRVERRAANSEQLEAQVHFTFVYRDE